MTPPPGGAAFGGLLDDLPSGPLPDELFTTLAATPGVRIERILSTGQASPEGFWYDQAWDEFVLLVQGAAGLQIEGEGERVLGPGDWAMIPARTRHRVAWTDPDAPTVWLAVHIGEP
ncbi:cupin domain-containing protein [Azospirillum rugosum]|uniref:Cupin 2 domain-containing protein n=1 Tax=Azospirillum rugosum TaxID=416170 RepID=A0ABS4SNN5_9PROT|nr:cupin domain-containing protein [Azospirillum rugosum]MBP2294102.1 cupin 2 domain-containing protein [Azospirillum rugosum]MDQ0527509.1 cupin 2 domain-containing protein [Azospirillum rugosum]